MNGFGEVLLLLFIVWGKGPIASAARSTAASLFSASVYAFVFIMCFVHWPWPTVIVSVIFAVFYIPLVRLSMAWDWERSERLYAKKRDAALRQDLKDAYKVRLDN